MQINERIDRQNHGNLTARRKLTCLKSCGFEITIDFGFPGVPPKILDIKFLGFIVPYPLSHAPSPVVTAIELHVHVDTYESGTQYNAGMLTFPVNKNSEQALGVRQGPGQIVIIIDGKWITVGVRVPD